VAATDALGSADGPDRRAAARPSSRAGGRLCARPDCSTTARATLSFDYASRRVYVEPLFLERSPQTYDLCSTHAGRTTPPNGWHLQDRRSESERHEDVPAATPADLGDDRTVALLAAALRAVPDPVSEDALGHDVTEVGRALAPPPAPPPTPPRAAVPRPVLAARSRGGQAGTDETPPPDEVRAPTLWA
jgi:hypothetical protein